jgi:hypothetical protein
VERPALEDAQDEHVEVPPQSLLHT